MLEDSGFANITIGPGVDTFGGTPARNKHVPSACTAIRSSPSRRG
jgi:hypothetical protein